uniref:Uncharacterized protein n=1 Tax=Romanomermis culicivorax TaxID=13658 RepID=A0A915I2S4_ROMCU
MANHMLMEIQLTPFVRNALIMPDKILAVLSNPAEQEEMYTSLLNAKQDVPAGFEAILKQQNTKQVENFRQTLTPEEEGNLIINKVHSPSPNPTIPILKIMLKDTQMKIASPTPTMPTTSQEFKLIWNKYSEPGVEE